MSIGRFKRKASITVWLKYTQGVLAIPLAGGRLLLAGEATHRMYFGTVHGALETGAREAERAAQLLREIEGQETT